MPLQNRVTPWGEIISTPVRGLFMGNRGCLHDKNRHVVKQWARTPWVTCALKYKDRHREVMSPGKYTELFFLDEATALAAGHRPCSTCRRDDFSRFKALWMAANAELAAAAGSSMAEIDKALHAERVDENRNKRTWTAPIAELPDGCMVVLQGSRSPLLIWKSLILPWSPGGYGTTGDIPVDSDVDVLTPPSVVNMLKTGYIPIVHSSAGL